MTSVRHTNHGAATQSRGASQSGSGAPTQGSNHIGRDRGRLAVGGALVAALAVGGLVAAGGGSSVSTEPVQAGRSAVGVPAGVYPYLEVEGRGSLTNESESQVPEGPVVESERPLLLDGAAFAEALAAAAAAADGHVLLDGEDLARSIEWILANAEAEAAADTEAAAEAETNVLEPTFEVQQWEEGPSVVPPGAS